MGESSAGIQYQLFPDLTVDEYGALKADIARRGVLVPIEFDEAGAVLDGHHRLRACHELSITEYPQVVRSGLTETEKREHVLKLNLLRRHLGPVSWAEAFKRLANERGVRLGHGKGDPSGKTATVAVLAKELGVPERTARRRLSTAETLAPHPDLAGKVDRGEMEVKRAERVIRERAADQRRAEPTEPTTVVADITIHHGDFRAALEGLEPGSVDAIITDPPYTAEMLDGGLDALADLAARVLKPSGLLVVMFGTGTIPEVTATLGRHLTFRWCIAWLTPGPRARMHHAKIGTGWKPVYLYQPPEHDQIQTWLLDDVIASTGDDKDHHHWGQNADGFRILVEALTEPGDLVVDPFLGGGTTALVCKERGRRFIGCDIDAAAVATARERVA